MSIDQSFLRRRIVVRRVASVCGVFAVLPLFGCGSSFESAYDIAGRGRNIGLQSKADVRPKSDVVQSYNTVPSSATVQRASLAPLAEPAKPGAAAEPPSGGYILGAVDAGNAPVKLAQAGPAYGPRRQQPPQYESDYQAEARRGYAPEPRYREEAPRGNPGRDEGPRGGNGGSYVVQPGDTLYAIAERHGLSVEELSGINGLSGEIIHPGQELRVNGGGRGEARVPREARPYREPAPEREPAPYRERQAERQGDYRGAPQPSANVYQPRYDEAERYDARRGAEPAYREDRGAAGGAPAQRGPVAERPAYERSPSREREQAYAEPQGYEGGRQPEYTSSNSRFTPNGPFPPSPDAPWRGEAEWRRMTPPARGNEGPPPSDDPDAFEPQFEQAPRYETRRPVEPPPAYEPRQAYPAQRARPAPQPSQPREVYPAPAAKGRGNGGGDGSYVYTVQRGDTLQEIARRNGIDKRELAELNGLPANAKLTPGQGLRIPRGEGYDWGRPRPEASNQAPAAPAPLRQRSTAEAPRPGPTREAAQAARPAAPKDSSRLAQTQAPQQHVQAPAPQQAQPQRIAKAAEAPAPRRGPERAAPTEMVAEEAPPARAPVAPQEMEQPRAAAEAPASQPAEVAVVDPSAVTAAATAHAVTDKTATRECEALLASPEPRSAKTFRMPVQGMVVAKFGSQDDGSFNDGINFSVPKGTPVKAAENGVVAYAGDELPGFGNLVLIRHADGYVTAYAHNDELLVRKCDVVKRGQIISKAGASGKATAPQLHFELRKDSKPMDPDGQFSGT